MGNTAPTPAPPPAPAPTPYPTPLPTPLPTEPLPTPLSTPLPTPAPTYSAVCASGDQSGYRGTMASTGTTCQKWTDQRPHVHHLTPGNYPNVGLGDHNYCRNPDFSGSRAWWSRRRVSYLYRARAATDAPLAATRRIPRRVGRTVVSRIAPPRIAPTVTSAATAAPGTTCPGSPAATGRRLPRITTTTPINARTRASAITTTAGIPTADRAPGGRDAASLVFIARARRPTAPPQLHGSHGSNGELGVL